MSTLQASLRLGDADFLTRLAFHGHDLAHYAVLALGSVAVASGAARVARGRAIVAVASTGVLALVVAALTLPEELGGPARRLEARTGHDLWLAWLVAATSVIVPAAEIFGRVLARARVRWLAVALLLGIASLEQLLPVDVYAVLHRHPGARLFLAWAAAAAVAGALRGWTPPRTWSARRRSVGFALVGVALVALAPMPNRVRGLMARNDGSLLFPWWSVPHGERIAAWRPAHPPTGPWYATREGAPDIPAGPSAMPHQPPIVVLLTIDAVRADILDLPDAGTRLPALSALRRESVDLAHARSPGASTVATLSSVFASRYFSQLYWTERDGPGGPNVWPHRDSSERFPERLASHGVHTAVFAASPWLTNAFGVVDGFAEQIEVQPTRSIGPPGLEWAPAPDVVDAMIVSLRWLAREPAGPAFLYAHLFDPHEPYDSGGEPSGTDWDRYLAEIAVVDAQLARLRDELTALGLADRTILVVTSDHGEAFGEHDTFKHGTTLYDELVRVPLLVHVPGIAAKTIDTPVSLIDIGPTILDLFGVPTPGSYMGQSLVPLLRGHDAVLTRPLAFETRPKQALLLEDGTKVIRDLRYGTIEVFHLPTDPGELHDRFEGMGAAHDDALGRLAELFFVHGLRRPGYSTPRAR